MSGDEAIHYLLKCLNGNRIEGPPSELKHSPAGL